MHLTNSRWRSIPDARRSIAILIGGVTLLRLLLAAALPLLPQEAYYWSWSRHLDWSYFDHPPLTTYSIALTTAVFGQTSFGIKVAAVAGDMNNWSGIDQAAARVDQISGALRAEGTETFVFSPNYKISSLRLFPARFAIEGRDRSLRFGPGLVSAEQ